MLTFPRIGYMGRLGNQMFQFASTLGVADKTGYDAKFPLDNCFVTERSGPIDPLTGINTDVKCDLLDCFEINPVYFIPAQHVRIDSWYQETLFTYDPRILGVNDNTGLHGYLQTEKYFSHARDLILSQFTFKRVYLDTATAYMENIRDLNKDAKIVSIHVRRGDYVMYPDNHPVCSKEYYNSAIEHVKSEVDKPKFLVFSDDPEWCRNEFKGEEYIISDLGDPYIELCAMSLCNHHIIANSSFSWWGAWLNKNNKKIVTAPSKWFGRLINHDTSDIYCKNWKML